MRRYLLAVLLLITVVSVPGQYQPVDSLSHQLKMAKEDTGKAYLLERLAKHYVNIQPDSTFYYAALLVEHAKKLQYPDAEAMGFFYLSSALDRQGNYSSSLDMAYRCLHIAERLKKNKRYVMSLAYFQIGLLNRLTKDDSSAIINLRRAVQLAEQSEISNEYLYHFYSHLAAAYNTTNKKDSAFLYAYKGYKDVPENQTHVPFSLITFARIYEKLKDDARARDYLLLAIEKGKAYNSLFHTAIAENSLAALYMKRGYLDSCIYYAREALGFSISHRNALYAMGSSSLLSRAYEAKNNTDSTLKYLKMMLAIKDSMFSQSKMQEYQVIAFQEQQSRQQAKAREDQYRNQIKLYAMLSALFVVCLIAVILYRNNQQKQKAKRKIEQAYEQLKATQAQLIQQEKMVSLGELTAGIAHEIQNPLNFVNNFSALNKELISEMKEEISKGNYEEIKSIAENIEANEQKVLDHGNRADAIVKGMLQHSRASTGKKEPTDINALADEFLRLSYQSLRVKDNSFNANFITDFDEGIGKIDVAPQDIGRMLLNLYNNAFYAVNEKKKQLNGIFEPTVEVTTKRVGDKVQLSVKDNGVGVPEKVLDKIYQPFFTTKPTGQGTGLGLSLSYDIITKGHGGELKVESCEGKYTLFVVRLPLSAST